MLIFTQNKSKKSFKLTNLKFVHRLPQKLCLSLIFLATYAVADTEQQDINTPPQPFSYTNKNFLSILNPTPEQPASSATNDTQIALPENKTESTLTTSADNQHMSYDALRALVDAGQIEKAITEAKASLKKEDNVDIRVLLGYLLLRKGDYKGAKQQFETTLKNSPGGYPDAADGLAIIEIRNDNYQTALHIVDNGLQLNPTSKLLLDRRKQILSHLKNKQKSTTEQTSSTKSSTTKQTATDKKASINQTDKITDQTKDKKKLNAISVGYEHSSVSDLDEIWQWGSVAYKRYTPYGPIIARLNRAYRFGDYGTQYELEAYPHIWDGFYLYLNYGYSAASFLPNHQYNYEGFFSLPHSYEFSIGERILQFQSSTTQVYTGSIGKYIGNYWIAYRPYITDGMSNSLTIRRYFSSADSYISLTGSYGAGPSDITDPNDVSANRSQSLSLGGQFPIKENTLLCNWKIGNSVEHFPTGTNRSETDLDVGFTWKF